MHAHLRLFKGEPGLRVHGGSFRGSQPEGARVKLRHVIHKAPEAHVPRSMQCTLVIYKEFVICHACVQNICFSLWLQSLQGIDLSW